MNVLIVGAGLYGSVCAEQLSQAGHTCTVVEKRDHIGGNIYTKLCGKSGAHQHVYGAHIFHTNSDRIWKYINQFAEFNDYCHRIKANHNNTLYSFPINLFTINQVFGVNTPEQARKKIQDELIPNTNPANLEEWCLSTIGPTLYHLFIEGYTQKQWNRHPKQLPADIVKSLPVRFGHDDNYYNARYQGIPVNGYTEIVEKMLLGSRVILNTDFLQDPNTWSAQYDYVIYTGPIDAYFEHCYGHLEYRSLRFENEIVDTPDYQGCAVINYTDADTPYTRIIEHKHFYINSQTAQTLITREYPQNWQPGCIEYYPVNDTKNQTLFEKYQQQAELLQGQVHFGGRLSEYRYYDMDQVIGSALSFCKKFLNPSTKLVDKI